MIQRVKVSHEEVKYIQTEIEKILNYSREIEDVDENQQESTKRRFSTIQTKQSRDRSFGKRSNNTSNNTAYVSPDKKSSDGRNIKSPLKSTQKSGSNNKKSGTPKSKNKKVYSNKITNGQQEKAYGRSSPETAHKYLPKILQQRNSQVKKEKPNNIPRKNSANSSENISTNQLFKKWSFIDKNPNQQDSQSTKKHQKKGWHKKSQSQVKSQQKKKSSALNVQKQPNHTNSTKQNEIQEIRKKYFPHGLIPLKNQQMPTDSSTSTEVIYNIQTERDSPYHLNRNNEIPIRDQGDYLQRKFKQKRQRKYKKEELILKYHILDQRLNKLRQEINQQHLQSTESQLKTQQERKRIKSRQDYKDALKSYFRYSPLKKLIKTNQRLKTQFQKNVNAKITDFNVKKVKELYLEGRPLWNESKSNDYKRVKDLTQEGRPPWNK